MARPRTGTLRRRNTARGVVYGVQFPYSGGTHYVRFGGSWEGWDETRAETERAFLMQKVDRGEWTPPVAPATDAGGPTRNPSFQLAASQWLHTHRLRTGDPDGTGKTSRDLHWRLSVAVGSFGEVPIDRVGFRQAEALVSALCHERLEIERARELGAPLTQDYTDPRTGRTHQRRRRGLSNSSIRKVLDAAERVLRDAAKRGEIAAVPDLKAAAPKAERPLRSFLEPEQIAAVLRAAELIEAEHRGLTWENVAHIRSSSASAVALARELGVSDTLIRRVRKRELWTDAAEPRNRNDVPRRAIVEALILLGVRVSELCSLDAGHLDLRSERVTVPYVKTAASERVIPMLPALREQLIAHRLDRPGPATAPAFATRTGGRQHPDNIRGRILAPVHARANELLAADGRLPIARLTPHTLRRTFASILASCNVPPRRAMYLLGHTDPKFTLAVYQQVLDMGTSSVEILEQVMGTTLDGAGELLSGRRSARVYVPNTYPSGLPRSGAPAGESLTNAKTPPERGLPRSG